MKSLQSLLAKKRIEKKISLDDKTIFFVFNKILKEEFGNIGTQKIKTDYFSTKTRTIFVKSESSVWLSELWINKAKIIKKINHELGHNFLNDIKNK